MRVIEPAREAAAPVAGTTEEDPAARTPWLSAHVFAQKQLLFFFFLAAKFEEKQWRRSRPSWPAGNGAVTVGQCAMAQTTLSMIDS